MLLPIHIKDNREKTVDTLCIKTLGKALALSFCEPPISCHMPSNILYYFNVVIASLKFF